ncbi:MAG TPA: hypothetical protein VNF47_20530 [Streptosporangiaceae bacterium]|nr:hypothetical protein [Streptosporangiaceae bacterium]
MRRQLLQVAAIGGMLLSSVAAAGGPAVASQHRAAGTRAAIPVFRRAVQIWLPAGAGAAASGSLLAVDCVRRGWCVAGGEYDNGNGLSSARPMIVTESGGRWGQAIALHLGRLYNGAVTAIDCTSPGNCMAGGYYSNFSGKITVFTVTERAGRWGGVRPVRLPGNALEGEAVGGIACPRLGACVAVGTYAIRSSYGSLDRGWLAMEQAGRWQQAREIGLPAGAPQPAGVGLSSVACAMPGSCVAVGWNHEFLPNGHNNGDYPVAVTEAGGRWRRAVRVPLPPDTTSPPHAYLVSVSCPRAGACLAAGDYTGSNDNQMVATSSAGRWGRARGVDVMPPDADASFGLGFTAMACPARSLCVAIGEYHEAGDYAGMAAIANGATWSATEIGPPANATADSPANAVDCTAAGYCAIVGSYPAGIVNHNRQFHAMAVTTR